MKRSVESYIIRSPAFVAAGWDLNGNAVYEQVRPQDELDQPPPEEPLEIIACTHPYDQVKYEFVGCDHARQVARGARLCPRCGRDLA
jgi:hypothetical protein